MVNWYYPMHFISLSIDDDYVDRLHHFLTSLVLIVCVLGSSKRQYFGSPITCWTPKLFTRAHVEYAEDVCWVKNTYFLPMSDQVPLDPEKRGLHQVVTYYQWVPFVLLIQAILFQFPNFLWTSMHDKSGFRLRNIVESACYDTVDPESRRTQARSIAVHIADYIRMRLEGRMETRFARMRACIASYIPLVCSRNVGNFLCAFYLLSKALYLINVVGQLFLMTVFLGSGHSFLYGFEVLANLSLGYYWEASGQFPRVTLCDFSIRVLGNLQRHTLQCVLPINRINEKIYLILWLWFFFLTCISVVNLLRWIGRLYVRRVRLHYVRYLLSYVGGLRESKDDFDWRRTDLMVCGFLDRYLLMDGVFILHLLSHNAGQLITGEIVMHLWAFYETEVRKMANGHYSFRSEVCDGLEDADSDGAENIYNLPLTVSLPPPPSIRETMPRRRSRIGDPGYSARSHTMPATAIL